LPFLACLSRFGAGQKSKSLQASSGHGAQDVPKSNNNNKAGVPMPRQEEVRMTKEEKKEKIQKIYNILYKEYQSRAVAVKRTAKLTGVAVATVAFLTSQY